MGRERTPSVVACTFLRRARRKRCGRCGLPEHDAVHSLENAQAVEAMVDPAKRKALLTLMGFLRENPDLFSDHGIDLYGGDATTLREELEAHLRYFLPASTRGTL